MSDFFWSEFVQKGDKLFDYMTHHFDEMFNEDGSIKHFDMRFMSYSMVGYYHDVFEEHGKGIHDALLPWIHEEYRSGRLVNKEDWKPFRDEECVTKCYYGYRTLFMYEKYYLQLAIDEGRFTIPGSRISDYCIVFEVALYGWKEDGKDYLASDDEYMKMPEDMRMPEKHWKRK